MGVDNAPAIRADAAGQFIKNVVRVFLEIGSSGQRSDGRFTGHGLIHFRSFHSAMSALLPIISGAKSANIVSEFGSHAGHDCTGPSTASNGSGNDSVPQ